MPSENLLALDWFKFGASIIFAIMSSLIYWKVSKHAKGAMTSFQLNHDQVINEYKMMLVGNLLMVVAMGLYLYHGINPGTMVLQAAKGLYGLYIILIATILFRWVRRFQ